MHSASLITLLAAAAGVHGGVMTYYDDVNYGACGPWINAKTEHLVAVHPGLWTTANPNNDPICNKCVQVRDNRGNTRILRIRDKCMGCTSDHIDVSQPVFVGMRGSTWEGKVQVTWSIVDCSSGSAPAPAPAPAPSGGLASGYNSMGQWCQRLYRFAAGDSCWAVSSRYGISLDRFRQLNTWVNCANVWVGTAVCL